MLQACHVDVPGNSIAALLIVRLCVTARLFVHRMRVKPTVPLKRKIWLFVCWICLWPALRPRPPRCAGHSSSWLNTPRSKVDQNISFPNLQNVKVTYLWWKMVSATREIWYSISFPDAQKRFRPRLTGWSDNPDRWLWMTASTFHTPMPSSTRSKGSAT